MQEINWDNIEYSERGFANFPDMTDSYGSIIEIQESSNVIPSLWLRINDEKWTDNKKKSVSHLTKLEAIKLAVKLIVGSAFISIKKDEHDKLLEYAKEICNEYSFDIQEFIDKEV